MGHITSKQKTEYGIEYYGTWECGDFSITARPFKTFTEMTHKEVFTRTG